MPCLDRDGKEDGGWGGGWIGEEDGVGRRMGVG